MRVLLLVLHFITIFTSALVAGGQFFVLMVIVPVKRAFEARMSVQIHSAVLGHRTDRYMKPLGITSGVSGGLLLALPPEHRANIIFLIVGLLGVLGVVISSRYFNVASNREMAGWSSMRSHWITITGGTDGIWSTRSGPLLA